MAKADRDAILVALLAESGGMPPHFDLERFHAEVERWVRQGKTDAEIAQLIREQCAACAVPSKKSKLNPDDYYTVEAHARGGGIVGLEQHVLGRDVLKAKRRLSREQEGERLRFVVLHEGATPRRVGEYTKATVHQRLGWFSKR